MNFVQKPAYKGYKAYEYLEEGKDYPKIEWAQWDWAGRHVVELEPDQEAMVQGDPEEASLHQPSRSPYILPKGYVQH